MNEQCIHLVCLRRSRLCNNPFSELDKQDKKIWVDWLRIPIGEDWWHEIRAGIRSSDNFLFIISKASLSSFMCHLKIHYARNNNKRIIPLILSGTKIDDGIAAIPEIKLASLNEKMLKGAKFTDIVKENEFVIKSRQWRIVADADEPTSVLQDLLTTFNTDYAWVAEHTRIQNRASEWEDNVRENSFLLEGKELKNAANWLSQSAERKGPPPTSLQNEYIHESKKRSIVVRRRIIYTFLAVAILSL